MQTDAESARLSNVLPYKFNTNGSKKGHNKNSSGKQLNIRKINPNTVTLNPVSRGSGVGAGLKVTKTNSLADHYHTGPQVSQTIPAAGGDRSVLGPEYMSGNQSIMSGGTMGSNALPELKKVNNRVGNRTVGMGSAGSATKTVDSNTKLRKASPEAIALMMANKKQNDAASQGSSHWVPGGSKALARDNSRQRKLFY